MNPGETRILLLTISDKEIPINRGTHSASIADDWTLFLRDDLFSVSSVNENLLFVMKVISVDNCCILFLCAKNSRVRISLVLL